jgi:hypothetical protein
VKVKDISIRNRDEKEGLSRREGKRGGKEEE